MISNNKSGHDENSATVGVGVAEIEVKGMEFASIGKELELTTHEISIQRFVGICL
ncbi:MAG: hypothetical protein ABSA79_12015 [Candidatus Bathyarchaeia archaeon]|jgi:hypothetical protein